MNAIFLTCQEQKLCYCTLPPENFSEIDNIEEFLQNHSRDTFVVFDLKELLHKIPALANEAPEKFFDVKLACYVYDPANDTTTPAAALKAIMPEKVEEPENPESVCIFELYKFLQPVMQSNQVFNDIEMPLTFVLYNMEKRGIALDAAALKEYGKTLEEKISAIEKNIYLAVGKTFNINSTKQLSEILFETLALQPAGKKTRSGYSTDAEALEKMRSQHPVIGEILNYRKFAKLNSTYVEGLLKNLRDDGKIHTTFNMTSVATGRLSSVEPNLQNLPAGSEIRRFFVAGENHVLIDADYSQIELRLLAHIANDPVMIKSFCNNEDIHTAAAAQIFSVAPDQVTAEMRRKAKAVNFGIVYGMSAFALANDLNIPQDEAKEYIKRYFEKYSAVKNYLDNSVKKAKENGFAETVFHRRRYLAELKSKIFAVRSFGERVALNMPIQGTAADLIKLAMIKVDNALKSAGLQTSILLQVHDELLLSAPESEAEHSAVILKENMENIFELRVPLTVSLAIGKNYGEVK